MSDRRSCFTSSLLQIYCVQQYLRWPKFVVEQMEHGRPQRLAPPHNDLEMQGRGLLLLLLLQGVVEGVGSISCTRFFASFLQKRCMRRMCKRIQTLFEHLG